MRSKSPLTLATLINTKRISLAIVLALGSGALISCGGGGDSARVAQTVDASKNGVTRIELEDNEGYAHFKGTLQLNLNGRNSENALTNLNSKASWKLSDTSLGSIRNGLFTAAGKPGELIVTAEYAGLSTTQNIIVSDANLISISVTPANSSVDECKNASFTANALFDNGLTLEYPLTWAITEGATLASFNDDTKGELSTKNSGTVSIVARGKNNSDETISSPVLNFPINDSLVSVALRSDKTLNMREGESATVTLTGTYNDNSTAVITSNSNLTAAPSASLTIEGAKITAKNGSYAGTDVVLTGSCGGQSGELDLVILKKQIKSIEIKNSNGGTDNLSVTEGGNLDLNITATFADDSTDSNYDYNVNWSIVDSKSDDFDDDLITLDQTGKLSVSGDLDLALNQQLKLVVRAEVRDENDKVVTNAQGQQLVDEINIVVRP
ncbi:hypothetical protein [Cellvibrio sp. PSBB023]|uniref:hypothetical protein n=1 Tax=Cellvibrio sp. PSBB023 TaxID=1945512 RepID=UPI00098FDCA2|nr:hypothetical protein [Cellvibrio sp. PSBB023]AQT61930.1 hypothetical protein B0D95_18815 [Cellvibrio sp. PSBB023]